MSQPCTMGVGCDEYGVCYAEAHGDPKQCPHYKEDRTMSTELRECPFGHPFKPKYPPAAAQRTAYTKGSPDTYRIMCACGAQGPHAPSPTEAIAAWNTRALLTELKTLRARVREAEEVIRPFARIADMEQRAGIGASVMVNVERCRAARAFMGGNDE